MEESLVNFVLGKLWDLIEKEAKHLCGVRGQAKRMHNELTNIRCYLRDADSKRKKGNESVENWLNQLCDVAYRIEDATDTFYLELDDNDSQKNCCCLNLLKNLALNMCSLHKLGNELGDIQKRLDKVFRSKDDYGIEPQQDESRVEPVILPERRSAYQDVEETEIAGLDAAKHDILNLLLNEEIHRRAVVTIVGVGGIGKTTLARLVYERQVHISLLHILFSPPKPQKGIARLNNFVSCDKLSG